MNIFEDPDKGCDGDKQVRPGKNDTQVQLVISLALGLSAFLAFCVGAAFLDSGLLNSPAH
jgi:hypothetical protein